MGPRPRERALPGLAALVAVLACALPATAQVNDTTLAWSTFETPHFRVHYHSGLREAAERVGAIGEGIYTRIGTLMGNPRPGATEVVLTDQTDEANGNATAVPYNTIRLYVAPPEDLSTIGDYDDWLQALFVHEYTHLSQFDRISGIPALINAIFGRVYPPNQVQPRWLLEGIAVYSESAHTTGGRLRSSLWDMYLRADALGNNLATLDQVTTGPNRWPHGNIWYLYGSFFVEYVVQRFGARVLGEIAAYSGSQVVPFGFNRALRRSTGTTYEELYPAFLDSVRARYRAQRDAIVAQGLEEGERITFQGEEAQYPRFFPGTDTVVYQSYDGQSHAQLRTVDAGPLPPLGRRALPLDGAWLDTFAGFAFDHDGGRMILADLGFHRDIYFYRELYARSARRDATGALATWDSRAITDGSRASYPDVAPDDDHVAFTAARRGTGALYEYSLTEGRARQLLAVRPFETVYTPRYAPDGSAVAFSHWQRGGFRDIRVLDRATHAVRDLTHDRALDMTPVYTPDGRHVVFASDRTGVFNLYAIELATGTLRQVTNVVSGAFQPAISPDGRTLVYVGYGHLGYDLYRLPLDPTRWRDPQPVAARDGESIPTPPVAGRTHPYDPLPTLRPQSWSLDYAGEGYAAQVGVSTGGADVVGFHSYSARVGVTLARGDPTFDLAYGYAGLRPGFRVHAYRALHTGHWRVGQATVDYPLERWGGDVGVSVSFPASFVTQSLSFSYGAEYLAPLGGVPFGRYVDPSELATAPPGPSWNAGIRAGWRFSRVQRYTYAVTAEDGFEAFLGVHATDRALGSRYGSFDMDWGIAGYVPMPWGPPRRRHVLALRLAGGVGVTDRGAPGLFSVGGFPTYSPADFLTALTSLSAYSPVALRGYPSQPTRVGNQFYLANVEYRFPLVQVDRGVTTLPVFLQRLYGAVFCDVGNAYFGPLRVEELAVGCGAELFVDFVLGYFLPFTMRFGVAQGLTGGDAITQPYALMSSPF